MKMKEKMACWLILILITLGSFIGYQHVFASMTKITVNIVPGVESNSILYIGQEKGIFAKYDLEVEVQAIPSNMRISSLQNGAAQFSLGSVSDITIRAHLAGATDIKIIASLDEQLDYRLVVAEDIYAKGEAGLKGETITIPYPLNAIVGIAGKMTVRDLGLDPEKDVNYVSVQDFPTATKFLVNGVSRAAMLNIVYTYQALKANSRLKVLANFNKDYPLSSIIAKESYLMANPKLTGNFLRAIAESIVYFKNNELESKKIIAANFGHKDPKLIELIYDYYKKVMSPTLNLYPKPDLLKTAREFVIQSQPLAVGVDLLKIISSSFVDELEKEGFMDEVRKQMK